MLATALLLVLTVPATVVSVYDGDTIKVQAEIWPGVTWAGSVRVLGVDSPERRGKCSEEKAAALAAKKFVERLVGGRVLLHGIKLGKFAGRVLANVQIQDGSITDDRQLISQDLAELLIDRGHARPYDGGKRAGWCGSRKGSKHETQGCVGVFLGGCWYVCPLHVFCRACIGGMAWHFSTGSEGR